jgi:polyisoprenoid-binding protein YceI
VITRRAWIVLCLLLAPAARAGTFVVSPGDPNQVVFVSKAATESFEGKTNRMSGTVVVDSSSVGDSITVHIEVDLASLDTGIGKRNQHMRENHLETGRFPIAVFDGATVHGAGAHALTPGKSVVLDVEGTFTLHGVSRRLRVSVTVTPRDARTLEFVGTFPVPLADYGIARPTFLFLKLGEVQQVTVRGVAVAAP